MRINLMLMSFLMILLYSCGNQKELYIEEKTKVRKGETHHTISSYIIDDAIVDSINYNYFSIYQDDLGVDYIFLLNQETGNFEVYNLAKKSLVFKKPYHKFIGDPDKYGDLNSIHFHNFDSIFIAQEYLISLIDTTKIIYSTVINEPESDVNPKYTYANQGVAPIVYDAEEKGLLIQTYCSGCKFHEKDFYKNPVESIIKLDSMGILKFPTQYSKKYLEGYYGFANQVHRTVYKEFSYYSFPIDPNIYIFNRKNNVLNIVGGRSDFQMTEPATLEKKHKNNSKLKMRHLTEIPFYHQVIYDPYKKYFYRFFFKELPDKNEDGTYNSWGDKEQVLMVFNEQFELLKEVELENYKYSTAAFVTKDGLFIQKSHYKNPKYDNKSIKYDVFKFSEK